MLLPNAAPRSFVFWVSLAVVVCAALTALFAGRKGYNRPLWFLAGLFFPNLLVVFVLPNLNKTTDDSKRLRWEFISDLGPFLGYCVGLFIVAAICSCCLY